MLINSIETIIDRDWPFLDLSMPALPYTCTKKPGSGHQVITGPATNFVSQLDWGLWVSTDLRSFLIGQHTADADLLGAVTPHGNRIAATTWPATSINYLFMEAPWEVTSGGVGIGVTDLGQVNFSTTGGGFWNGNLHIVLDLVDGDWDCTVGPPGATVRKTGRNIVDIDYPIAWTPVQSVIAEAVREQFRRAARITVTGAP